MPVYRYLDLSTSHLTEKECDELGGAYIMGDLDHSPRVIAHDYGAWVNVPELGGGSWSVEDAKALAATRPNLLACIVKARELDCKWINFDQDADTEEGLPVFDW